MTTVEKKAQNTLPFPQKITEYDQYLFAQATNYDIYNKLGSHLTEKDFIRVLRQYDEFTHPENYKE